MGAAANLAGIATEHHLFNISALKSEKMESLGVLAGGLAHDFNNLLKAIVGNLSLAQLDTEVGSPQDRALRSAQQASDRAREVAGRLLTFSRGGAPVTHAEAVVDLLRETASFILHGSKVAFRLNAQPDLPLARIDRGQFNQALENIVLNAAQAMPDGGTIDIDVATVHYDGVGILPITVGDYLRIDIRDTGIGIAPQHLPQIFDPYFSTKEQGRGLGLATSYSILKRHAGHLEVASTPGEGTRMTLHVPAAGQTDAATTPSQATTAQELHPLHLHVLVMDDEPDVLDVAANLLERMDCTCEAVADGPGAVAAFERGQQSGRPFDAVILDLTIPGGAGGDIVVNQLLALDPEAFVLVSSGYTNSSVMADHAAYGFSAMLPKPYQPMDLHKALAACPSGRMTQC